MQGWEWWEKMPDGKVGQVTKGTACWAREGDLYRVGNEEPAKDFKPTVHEEMCV